MYIYVKRLMLLACIVLLFYTGTLIADKLYLRHEIIRVHVIANSDSSKDQDLKLIVKDAVKDYLSKMVNAEMSCSEAYTTISNELPNIKKIISQIPDVRDMEAALHISLSAEAYPMRMYETFRLPSGVYQSLNIEIGDSKGTNWWCVAFPSLCEPITNEDFVSVAAESGINNELINTISYQDGYEVRFMLLDFLGKLENIFANLIR